MSEYIRVTPTSEKLRTAEVPAALESLHKLTNPAARNVSDRLNPFADTAPPTFEFLAISEGEDDPVEFYYGIDHSAHLETLEKQLRTIYPQTFDITRSELDLEQKLVQPVDYTRDEYRERLEDGRLLDPPLADERDEFREDEQTDGGRSILEDEVDDTAATIGSSLEVEAASSDSATVSARPPLEDVDPIGVQWYGRAQRKRDWMTTIKSFAGRDPDPTEYNTDQPPLATLIDHLTELEYPIAFQVVWQRKDEWTADAELRVEDLRDGRDTFGQRYIGPLFETSDLDADEREPTLGNEAQNRIDRIQAKHPKRTFSVNARAVAIPPTADGDLDEKVETQFDQLAQSLNALDGPFYELEGQRLRSKGVLTRTKRKRARAVLNNILHSDLTTGRGKRRPDLVLNADELANLTVVPSSQDLTVEGSRGTRSEQRSRNPLPRPHPDLMDEFREGMAIGYAIDENGETEQQPVRIPPSLLPTHYVRAATTGGGKSKSLTNDKLSLYDQTDGPIILIDAKGDGLCEDYMRAHAHRFGVDDLEENVLHFPIPEVLPGFAFFNIERQLENGVRRVDAVQNKADHYEEILKMVMGEDRYERAVVAPTLIKYLIKALYDEEHGRENGRYRESVDYFAHDQLEYVVDQLWQAGPPNPVEDAAPRSSNAQVQRRLDRQLQLDPNTFATVMGGVSNRLDYISQDEHLRRVFNNTESQFDFRDVLDDRNVILFDLGGLRDESAKAMTGVILTELYNALRERGDDIQQKPDDYVVNLIIDEASSLAVSDVMNTLLEKGRSFRLSVGLSLQFPEQLDVKGGREVYLNVLNDVGSPIIGKIAVDNEIAKVMAHEDMDPVEFANRIRSLPRGEWIVRLPSPTFGETGPEPFSLAPLPIPSGHPESATPLTASEEQAFQSALERIHERADSEYGVVTDSPPTGQTPSTVRETFELGSDDLDVALANAVRTVQHQQGVREANGWVPVQLVDQTLRTRYEAADASPPSIEELGEIRDRSRLLEVTLDQDTGEIVVRLTDDGEAVTEPDTGDVRSSGSELHDELLIATKRELSQEGFDVTIFTQDGSEKPDGRAVHPDCEAIFDIEVESTTVDKPVKVLRNFQRAREAEHVPLFVVTTTEDGDNELQTAARLEDILASPVNELESGEVRLYTTDSHITFDGGANVRDGVTAVRPATGDSRRSVWTQDKSEYRLSDGLGTEFVTVSSLDSLSRSDVPAVYSYDRATDEYVVYEPTKRHRYDSKSAFEQEWVPIREPFVPETVTSTPDDPLESSVIAVLEKDSNSMQIYRDGQRRPLDSLVDVMNSQPAESCPGPAEGNKSEASVLPVLSESDREQSTASSPTEHPEQNQSNDSQDVDFGTFVEDCLLQQEGAEIAKADLYTVYEAWTDTHDHEAYARSWFGRKLSEHVSYDEYRPTRDGERVRHYTGITLSSYGRNFFD
ncbi:ATP-binding protein [Natronolimnobius sp. AArcel1]|uniref:ATP-binding protein n=1 Tax=Natronolimnobius sp. AArcel1 TaxID=1679093 RepID=UPI0013ECF0D6|nr:ATP-binding protein [Natronolimnobius sp. AArcel1]NGM71332.1 ATP-binding protein [Natronolimnobius sp. AArcel1]